MGRWTDLLRSKGFYIALGTGIIAFASLIVMYTNYNPGKDVTKEQAIDLNQPAEIDDNTGKEGSIVANTDSKKKDENKTTTEEEAQTEVTTESSVQNTENESANENDTEEITEELVDVSGDGAMTASGYNGEDALAWPTPGNIIIPFSMDTTVYFKTLDIYKCNPGIVIESTEGSNVCAAYPGVVESITDSKEYGTVMTIDMGNGYKAVYGQLMNLRVREGDFVEVNQIIAEVAPVSAYYVEEGCNLYFALTRDEAPVNPIEFMQ